MLNFIRWLMILCIILIGISVGALRLFFPTIQNYKAQIAEHLQTTLGVKINIGNIEAKLSQLTPELKLTNTTIQLPNNNSPIHLQKFQVWFDPLASIQHKYIRLAGVSMSGVKFTVQFLPNQPLSWKANTDNQEITDIIKLLLTYVPLSLINGTIQLEQFGYTPLNIHFSKALLVPNKNSIDIEINTEIGTQSKLTLLAHVDLQPVMQAKIYLKTDALALDPILSPWLPSRLKVAGILDTELWIKWNGSQANIIGPVILRDIEFKNIKPMHYIAPYLAANIEINWKLDNDWNVRLANGTWQHYNQTYKDIEVDVYGTKKSLQRIRLSVPELQVEQLINSVTVLPLPKEIISIVNELAPRGQIQNLLLELTSSNENLHWEVGMQLNDVSYKPWAKVPGISNLNIELRASSNGGQARLMATEMILLAPKLFRGPLSDLQLVGDVEWINAEDKITVKSNNLMLENHDMKTNFRILTQIPLTGDTPFLDVQGNISGEVATVRNYLPVGVMKKPLIDWLDNALVAGQIKTGKFMLRGVADDFPFRTREGRFEADLDIEDLILKFADDWPPLEDAAGKLRFLGPGLEINLLRGKLLDSQINTAQSYVADIKPAAHLPITGQITGPFTDVLRILRGPLANTHGRYAAGMEVQGDSAVQMKIAIPIEPWANLQLDGKIHWQDAALQMEEWKLDLHNIIGEVRFTDAGLFAQDVSAQIGDHLLYVNVDTEKLANNQSSETNLDINFPLNSDLISVFASEVPWQQWLEGESLASLRLTIPHNADNKIAEPTKLKYQLDSSLNGLAVKLPSPLGKPANALKSIYINGILPFSSSQQLSIDYGELRSVLNMQSVIPLRIVSGEVLSNTKAVSKVNTSGLNISGKIQRLDIPGWMNWLNTFSMQSVNTGINQPSKKINNMDFIVPPIQAKVRIGELGLAAEPVKNLDLTLKQINQHWEAQIQASNIIGHIKVPINSRSIPIQAQFNLIRLEWPNNSFDTDNSQFIVDDSSTIVSDPRQASAMDITIKDLQLGTQSFGKVYAKLRPDKNGLQLKQFSLDSTWFNVKGAGTWYGNVDNQETDLHLEMNSKDFGEALRNLGFTSALKQASLHATANVNWPTSPQDWALDSMYGHLSFNMGAGQVVDVDPGVGRLFGLLSLETLQRRLSLDFSDLFGQGFAFDSFTGNFNLQNGDAITPEIKIEGPSAVIKISGRTGLKLKDYDQLISVTPAISSTLSIAGAVAGGPITGAALLVAGQVIGEKVNELMRLQYQLTGSWQQPNLIRIQTKDGWSLSNLLISK